MKFIIFGISILLTFFLGYFIGWIGVETLLKNLLLNIKKLDLMETIGFSSSIITLFLFITFVIGRIILIKKMKVTFNETVELTYKMENIKSNVIEEYNLGELNSEFIYLSSTQPLRWIRFYDYDFNNPQGHKGKLITEHKFLANGQALKINTYLPCGVPKYLVEQFLHRYLFYFLSQTPLFFRYLFAVIRFPEVVVISILRIFTLIIQMFIW